MHRSRVALALALIMAGVPALSGATRAAGAAPDLAEAVRSGPAMQTVALPAAGAGRVTSPFSLLGVTWADPRVGVSGVVQVRTRSLASGRWGQWQSLEADGGAAGTRGATDPLWVGNSDGVQARIAGARGPLPSGLRLDLINPDSLAPMQKSAFSGVPVAYTRTVGTAGAATAGAATALRATAQAAPAGRIAQPARAARAARAVPAGRAAKAARAVALPARPVPRMLTRAQWGANEAMVKAAPEFTGPVDVFFVHHTATGNGYSCAQSASIVRGIQAYQVRSRGWDDIGYNFLIDKCGTIFEGRGGGVGRSVLGAHTLGFNNNASAIAVIGTYGTSGVSATVRTAIATVAAYKLGTYGNAPGGRGVLRSAGSDRFPAGQRVVFNRISGHRDAGRTDCPGDALYAQLPAIRAIAGAAPIGLRLLRVAGAVRYGSLLFTKGAIKPLWNVGTPSALIARFEVWVDGKLTVAAPGNNRTALVRLAPGGHTVTVRALHLSNRSTTVTTKVVADPVAPIFSRLPDVTLRGGSLNGSVPIRLGWTARDVNGLATVGLVRPTTVNLGTTARARNGTIQPGMPTTFVLRAVDRAGNAVNASVTRTPVVASEAMAQRSGTWRPLRNAGYLGGVALGATTAGPMATWTFTGRSAALAFGRGAHSGRVRIWVDGRDSGTVDLRSVATLYRQAVWARSWAASGSHTVRVEVVSPGVVLDGLVYLK